MKREYVKPVMMGEAFVANEYVATCYSGKCDITGRNFYEWNDKNNNGKVDQGELGDLVVWGNDACSKSFNAEGNVKRVATLQGFKWVTGWYFESYDGKKDTHVTSGYTVTNAS